MVFLSRRLVRYLIQSTLYLLLSLFLAISASAHEGHDHGEEKKPIVAEQEVPRLTVESELFQLVGTNDGNTLTLYIDDFATNAPIENALVEVTKDADTFIAKEISPAVYALNGDWLHEVGKHDLVISITAGENIDLLLGELVVPAPRVVDKTEHVHLSLIHI